MKIKEGKTDQTGEISSLGNSLGYAAVSGIVCGTIGGIFSDRKINDSGFVGGISGGIVAGVASGIYATRDFLHLRTIKPPISQVMISPSRLCRDFAKL